MDTYLAEPAYPTSTATMLEEVLELAQAPVIGVAGTSGKSTTAKLVQAMLRASGHRVSGDIETAYMRLHRDTPRDRVVIELPWRRLRCADGLSMMAVPSLAGDELPPGVRIREAAALLRNAVARTRDTLVVNADDAQCLSLAAATKLRVLHAGMGDRGAAASIVDGTLWVQRNGAPRMLCRTDDTSLAVGGLATDLLVAAAAALEAGASLSNVRRVAAQYVSRKGRHEVLGLRGGVTWINDAAATRPGRTATTLAGYRTPVTLIAGGHHGGQPLWRWAQVVASRVSHVLLFDGAAEALVEALRGVGAVDRVIRCADLADAMDVVKRITSPGDTVVFSPACDPGEDPHPGARFTRLVGAPDRKRVAA